MVNIYDPPRREHMHTNFYRLNTHPLANKSLQTYCGWSLTSLHRQMLFPDSEIKTTSNSDPTSTR